MKQNLIEKFKSYWLINNRYAVYFDGVIYDTIKAKDIPLYVFNIKAKLINEV